MSRFLHNIRKSTLDSSFSKTLQSPNHFLHPILLCTHVLTPRPALERTYLSYHRTSLALSLLSVIVSQLQILQHSSHPDPVFGFYTLGKPLAIGLILCAILISLLGWMRWWRWQRTLLRGKAMSGGWELAMTGGIGMAVILAFLGMVAAVSIRKSYFTKSHS